MKVSQLKEFVQYVLDTYGDIEIVKPHREDGWLYSEFEPITDVDVEHETGHYESTDPVYMVIS